MKISQKAIDTAFIVIIIFLFSIGFWALTRPCLMRPFSKHDCWCEGFKDGYGKYPNNCGH